MSVPVVSQQLHAASYSALVVEPALAVIRNLLLQDHPTNVIDYICERRYQIISEIEAAASADPRVAAFPPDQSSATASSPADSTPAAPRFFPSVSSSSAAAATAASPAEPTTLSPRPASVGGSSAALSTASGAGGKFDTFVMPCGKMQDFHKGLPSRIGFPHLEFEKAMEAEHTSMAGCDMRFTTRNYGITTTASAEWGVVVRGQTPPPEHMLHGRIMVSVEGKLRWINEQFAKKCLEMRLRREEVIAVILYTGPMYMMYNCILARWSNPAAMWDTLRSGNNLFATTLSVLVSAVQKLSTITVIPDGLKLYRGTGGLVYLPEHFSKPDDFNCRGMTEWGFMSCSANKEVAMAYSGAAEGRPHAMVLEIEPSFVDRGAVVSELSQYPKEEETLFLPMSYVAQSGERRVEPSATGEMTVIPVRVSVNLKAERVEQLEEKKKSIHLTGFEFRVNEVRQRLQRLMEEGGADARLKKEEDLQGHHWKKAHSVEGFVEAQMKKVEAVLVRHREHAAADYSDDDVYRKLVSESLEAARMAQSAVLWWLRDKGQGVRHIEDYPLLACQRSFESFLMLECRRSVEAGAHRAAVVELCRSRNLLRVDASERDENGETVLMALAARGGSAIDVRLLVAAGADVGAVVDGERSAMHLAAGQGHAEVVEALARAGADCNQADTEGKTPLWVGSVSGHLKCVEVLLKEGADANKARNDSITPLLIASQYGYCDVVDALLRGGADVNKASDGGCTPLFMASINGHCDVVDALIRGGASVNKATDDCVTPLLMSSQLGHCDVVEVLVRGGADVNKAWNDGGTSLFMASRNGHCDVVDALIRGGADVNKASDDGVTPLYMASCNGHCNVVEVLVRGGADVNKAWNDGMTPLYIASQVGHCGVVDALLRGGADVNITTNDGTTPLNVASQNGHCDVVEVLIRGGADVNKAWNEGVTPLLFASQNGHCNVVEVLLRGGADVNKAANNGVTPLYMASCNGHCNVVEVLLCGGADVNKAWNGGMTPLYIASQEGHCDVVDALLCAGADLTTAKGGQTPYSVAFFYGHFNIVAIMESAAPEVAQQQAQQYARVEADHAAAIALHRSAGCVVVNRHRGRGYVSSDYVLQLQGFNTFVADVRLCGGCFYFELQGIEIIGFVQFGFCSQGFEARREPKSEGAGDDAWSWAADGTRLQKWHDGPSEGCFGSEWAVGDIIGFALDMRTAGAAVMSVSVNGSFAAPNGVAFSDINAVFLSPAFSGDGRYRVNFGDRPFAHAPPDGEYTSVHDFHRQRQ